jgi:hypothetical protein
MSDFKFTQSGPGVGHYAVEGYNPELRRSFRFATIAKTKGGWVVEFVYVIGAEPPAEKFKTREAAAQAALDADLAARRTARELRTKDAPITVAILNSLMVAARTGELWVTSIEQNGDVFTIDATFRGGLGHESVKLTLDRDGNTVETEKS